MTRQRYFRKVIQIRAEDSPNVKLGMAQEASGRPVTNEQIVPGVLSWREYLRRRSMWDPVRQCVGLDAQFWKGKEALLYPPDWLNHSEQVNRALGTKRDRKAEGVGIDTAQGGDNTCFCAVDRYGVLDLLSEKTPDTDLILGKAIAFCRRWGVPGKRVCIDRGGGGKELADRMRKVQGFEEVRTVAFGEAVALEPKRGMTLYADRVEVREERYTYVNRRAQMYHALSQRIDPTGENYVGTLDGRKLVGFGLPPLFPELRRQLALIPRLIDDHGRYWLPSKGTVTDQMRRSKVKTLTDIIGHSPDEADACVLAVHALEEPAAQFVAGVIG